jgi:hypothetical protein
MKQPELHPDIYNIIELYNKEYDVQITDYTLLDYFKKRMETAQTKGIYSRYSIQHIHLSKKVSERAAYLRLLDSSIFNYVAILNTKY